MFFPQIQAMFSAPPVPPAESVAAGDGFPAVSPPKPDAPGPAGREVALRIRISPPGAARVTVNGALVNLETPVVKVRTDSPIEIVGIKDGYRTISRELALRADQLGAENEWSETLQFQPLQFGTVTIRTTPSADVILTPLRGQDRGTASAGAGGEVIRERTPLESRQIPTGVYSLKLVNEVLGMEKTLRITVEEGKALVIDERLPIKD